MSDLADIIDCLCKTADHPKIFCLRHPFLKEPDDDMLLEPAVSAECGIILSYNKKDFCINWGKSPSMHITGRVGKRTIVKNATDI